MERECDKRLLFVGEQVLAKDLTCSVKKFRLSCCVGVINVSMLERISPDF